MLFTRRILIPHFIQCGQLCAVKPNRQKQHTHFRDHCFSSKHDDFPNRNEILSLSSLPQKSVSVVGEKKNTYCLDDVKYDMLLVSRNYYKQCITGNLPYYMEMTRNPKAFLLLYYFKLRRISLQFLLYLKWTIFVHAEGQFFNKFVGIKPFLDRGNCNILDSHEVLLPTESTIH